MYCQKLFTKLASISNCLLLLCCLICCREVAGTTAAITVAGSIINVDANITSPILFKQNSTVYATKTTTTPVHKGAIIIQATKTGVTIQGITINGTADGSISGSAAVPSLLICATPDTAGSNTYSAELTITKDLTIGQTGYLTTGLEIKDIKKVTGNIINNGTITGDTCIQIGSNTNASADYFILNGTVTNSGHITATGSTNKIALDVAGKPTNDIKTFKFTNSGTVTGKFSFVSAGTSQMGYTIDNQATGVITTNEITVTDAKLNLTNAGSITITKITNTSGGEVSLTNQSKGNIIFGANDVTLKDVTNSATITAGAKLTAAKLDNKAGGVVEVTSGGATFTGDATNTGNLTAKAGLTATGKFTNSAGGVVYITGAADFKGNVDNTGNLTAKAGLTVAQGKKFTNSAGGVVDITGKAEFNGDFENKADSSNAKNNGIVTIGGAADFKGAVTNSGTITAGAKLTAAALTNNAGGVVKVTTGGGAEFSGAVDNNDVTSVIDITGLAEFKDAVTNSGTITAANGLTASGTGKFTNSAGGVVDITRKAEFNGDFENKADSSNAKNNGIVTIDGAADFKGAVTNSGTITAANGLTASGTGKTFTNSKGGVVTIDGAADFKGAVTNSGTITAGAKLTAAALTNSAGGVVDITGKAEFNGAVSNDGCLAVEAGASMDSYTSGSGSNPSELVIKINNTNLKNPLSNPLLTVANKATFNQGARITLAPALTVSSSPTTSIIVVKAGSFDFKSQTADAILGSLVNTNSVLLQVTNATLDSASQNITADIEATTSIPTGLTNFNSTLATYLAKASNKKICPAKAPTQLQQQQAQAAAQAAAQPAAKAAAQAAAKKATPTNAVTTAVNNLKLIAHDAASNLTSLDTTVQNGKDLTTAGVKVSELLTALDKAATDAETKEKIKAVLAYAGNKTTNKQEFLDYIAPDSSNAQVTTGYTVNSKLASHLNARIASKSNTFNRNKNLQAAKGINSGAITDSFDIWAATSYHGGSQLATNSNQDHSRLSAWAISLGLDTDVYKNITLGVSYAYNSSHVKNYGGRKGKLKGEDHISTNAIATYTAVSIDDIDIHMAFIYAHNSHKPKVQAVNYDDYSSNMLSLTTMAMYPLRSFSVSGQLDFTSIIVSRHAGKLTTRIPKEITNIITTGIGINFYETFTINNNMLFNYNLAFNYKLACMLGDETTTINLVPNDANTALNIKPRSISKHNASVDILLKLKLYDKVNLDLDINYGLGQHDHQYGVNFTVRYLLQP